MTVEYRIVTEWPAYRVGDDGSIWTRWRKGPGADLSGDWKPMNPTTDDDGYRRVDLNAGGGKSRTRKVSVLVCEAFHGPAPAGLVCRHRNGHCTDDRADNLVWGTTLENTNDRREHGTIVSGDRHGKTKLSESQIAELLTLQGTMIQREAAEKFGVSRGYVGQLWSGARKRVAQ